VSGRIAAAAFVLLWAPGLGLGSQVAGAPTSRVLVMPFENVTRDSRIVWLGEASAVLLADDLNALGTPAITRAERREAFERLQVPAVAALSDATMIRIGQIVAASQLVVGTLEMDGDTLVVHVRNIALEAGRVQLDGTERGPLSDLFAIFERIARRIAPDAALPGGEPERQHPPVAAFEDYIKGLLAEAPATRIEYLRSALRQQPSLDAARLALWDVYTDEGDHERALAAVQPVPMTSDSGRRARFLAGLSWLALKKYDEAFATFAGLADSEPTAPVLNNLGVVEIRRAVTARSASPTYYFNRAAEADPGDPDYLFNLGYACWFDRDTQAAIQWLREAVRRNPADGDAHYVLSAALSAAGNAYESLRERELAHRLSSTYAQWEKRPASDAVPRGLERVKSGVELPHGPTVASTLATTGQREQRELARFYLDRAHRLFGQENDREAIDELNRALYLQPYDAEAHLLLGRIYLRNGRLRDAVDDLKISLWSSETSEAHVVLGEAYLQLKDPEAARAEAERAIALDGSSAAARRLLQEAAPKDTPVAPIP
jgi:tetratricopeptide (TPR) repeat protein